MPGNRDFLIGENFLHHNNITLLEDPTEILLGKNQTLLMHGDTLCTTDYRYQIFRYFVRKKICINYFLSKSLEYRINFCEKLRERSAQSHIQNDNSIIDVSEKAVEKVFKKNNYPALLIHGHTHRLKTHKYNYDGKFCERWVLGDWYGSGNYLLWDKLELKNIFLS